MGTPPANYIFSQNHLLQAGTDRGGDRRSITIRHRRLEGKTFPDTGSARPGAWGAELWIVFVVRLRDFVYRPCRSALPARDAAGDRAVRAGRQVN